MTLRINISILYWEMLQDLKKKKIKISPLNLYSK